MKIQDRFQKWSIGRLGMPNKHILVCEDNLINQSNIAKHFRDIFPQENDIEVSYVSGGLSAASIIQNVQVDLIILDHDMPNGTGPDLQKWMASEGHKIPIITFSGAPTNNDHMMALGADHKFMKQDVIAGAADKLIKEILNVK